MSTESQFNDIREEVRRLVPSSLDITSIEFEGPTVVIYTKDFDKFAENSNITKSLANGLKKRVDIRPDPTTLKDSDEVEAKIREVFAGGGIEPALDMQPQPISDDDEADDDEEFELD